MYRSIIVSFALILPGFPCVSFGANGSNMIGISPASNALGGTGVANYTNGTDAIFKNPALLGEHPDTIGKFTSEFSTTVIKNNASANGGAGMKKSTAGINPLPNVAVTYQQSPTLTFGIGAFTYGGAATDYVGQAELTQLKGRSALFKMMPALGFRVNDTFSFGVGPFATVGMLSTNEGSTGTQSTRSADATVGVGAQVGAKVTVTDKVTFGATYISESRLHYKNILDFDRFGPNAAAGNAGLDNVDVQQPSEIAAGVVVHVTPTILVTLDYRFIGWSNAQTYTELGWKDQHVIALGTQYQLKKWTFRGGFNYAKSPIANTSTEVGTDVVNLQGHAVFKQSISQLNIAAYPGIAQSHVTLGAGYQLNDSWVIDAAAQYAPKVTVTRAGSSAGTPYSFAAQVSQWALSAGATYIF